MKARNVRDMASREMQSLRRAFWLIRIPADLPRFCGFKRSLGGPIISLSLQPLHFGVAERRSTRPPVAKAAPSPQSFSSCRSISAVRRGSEILRSAYCSTDSLGRNHASGSGNLVVGLGDDRRSPRLACQRMSRWMSANSKPLATLAQAYSALAALEGTVWALSLVLLPAASQAAAVLQLVLTVAVLLGTLLPFAPAGTPWVAFAVPLGFAQLTFLLSRDLPLSRITLVTWAMTLIGAATGFWLLRRALSSNVAMRTRANSSARAQEQANAEMNRSREQLRMALDAIDAGVATPMS